MTANRCRYALNRTTSDRHAVEVALERRHLARVQLEVATIGRDPHVLDFPFALRDLLLPGSIRFDCVQVRVAVGFTDEPHLVAAGKKTATRITGAAHPRAVLEHIDCCDAAARGTDAVQVSLLEVLPFGE